MAAISTFADVSLPQINMLIGTLGIPFPAPNTRVTAQAALVAHNALYVEDYNITQIAAPVLRTWNTALGLSEDGQRRTLVARLVAAAAAADAAANPIVPPAGVAAPDAAPEVPTAMISNVRQFHLPSLDIVLDREKFIKYLRAVQSNVVTNNVEEWWETKFRGTEAQRLAQAPNNPRQRQFQESLRVALEESFSEEISVEIDPKIRSGEIQDDPASIFRYIQQQQEDLGSALERQAETEFRNHSWKGSKKGLAAWVGELRKLAGKLGPSVPEGHPREHRIRQAIFSNVGKRDPYCAQVIIQYDLKEVSEADYTVDKLVTDLTKIMCKTESKGEMQCQTFSVSVSTEVETKALLVAKDKKIASLTKDLKKGNKGGGQNPPGNSNKNKNWELDDEANALYGGGWNGKGSGKQGGWGNNQNKNKNKSPFCHDCNRHFKALGKADEKWGVITSHYANECQRKEFEDKKKSKGKGKGGKNDVLKKNDKKKGKGKGKGKGKDFRGGRKGRTP